MTQPHVVWINLLGTQGYSVSVGDRGVFVAGGSEARRYDFNGTLVWTRQVGLVPYSIALGVASGQDGLYVVGHSFVEKLDFNGNLIWSSQFAESNWSWPRRVSVDSSGVYVAGTSIVQKFDLNGNEIWMRHLQPPVGLIADARGISVGPKGVYVTGRNYCPAHQQCQSFPGRGAFLKAFDHDGNQLWNRQSDGDPQVSVGPNAVYTIVAGLPDAGVLTKYDFNGTQLWAVASGLTETSASGVSATPTGIYVVGASWHDPSFPWWEAYVQRYNSRGTLDWSITFGAPTQDTFTFAGSVSASTKGILVSCSDFIAKVCASQSCIHNR